MPIVYPCLPSTIRQADVTKGRLLKHLMDFLIIKASISVKSGELRLKRCVK